MLDNIKVEKMASVRLLPKNQADKKEMDVCHACTSNHNMTFDEMKILKDILLQCSPTVKQIIDHKIKISELLDEDTYKGLILRIP